MKQLHITLRLLILFFLTLSIPLTFYLAQKAQELRSKAAQAPVTFTVDLARGNLLFHNWQNLAQGGEIPLPQLPPVATQLAELSPSYVRLDHIFDAYQVVRRNSSGKILYDFSLLDKEVDAILKVHAKPFLSLSYIPTDIADPNNLERPLSYDLWEDLVAATVSHYSGKGGKNIDQVYYEVYNEPDLFGKWSPDEYFALYKASVTGAQKAENVNPFLIGGPAITSLKRDFLTTFLTEVQKENLRIDFVSWHVYSPSPMKIAVDGAALRSMITQALLSPTIRLVVSEWGSYPEKHVWHDSMIDAAHLVATVSQSSKAADMLFYFEVKDGSPSGQVGGWGILRDESFGFAKKPRFYALSLLANLGQTEYEVTGENDTIYALAGGNTSVDFSFMATNYSFGTNYTVVPVDVDFLHLLPGAYEAKKTVLQNEEPTDGGSENFLVRKDEGAMHIDIAADTIVNLAIRRTSAAVAKEIGITGDPSDSSAKIASESAALFYPINFSTEGNVTEVAFAFRQENDTVDNIYFASSSPQISLVSEIEGFSPVFSLSVTDANGKVSKVSVSKPLEFSSGWHTARMIFDNKQSLLSLSVDGVIAQGSLQSKVNLSGMLAFGGALNNTHQFIGAIDNVAVSVDGNRFLEDIF